MTAPTGPDRTGVVARLDALEAAHKGATRDGWHVMRSADDRRAYVITTERVVTDSAGCAVADAAAIVAEHNSYGHLLAVVRGVLDLADEMAASADMPDTHGEFDRGVAAHQRDAADRLRSVVAAALGEA